MPKLIPNDINDPCDCCRDQPLKEEMPEEAIGRQYLKINVYQNFNELFDKINNSKRELLLSFDLTENDLNQKSGKKLIEFLNKLKTYKIRFKIGKPILKCVLGHQFHKIMDEFEIPTNCYECSELFTVENEDIISCKHINKKGPKIYYMEDRNQIAEFFNVLRLEKQPCKTCISCIYFKRKQCDGSCFRKL